MNSSEHNCQTHNGGSRHGKICGHKAAKDEK